MCGVFGVIKPQGAVEQSQLELTAKLLNHRGPDAQGCWQGEGVGLAHARLSLVDLNPRSNQPMWDSSKRYALVYNGEIYNFRKLREELVAQGVSFETTSDTEVLLQLLIRNPAEAVLPKLEGMFAFGFYDRETGDLLLARDRFGMKPLYVYEGKGMLAFASETKAFRPWLDFELDQLSISSYLLGFGGPTKGFTFYKNVRSVPPGWLVRFRAGGTAEYQPFFVMTDFLDGEEIERLNRFSPSQMVDHMDELLYTSVEQHMFADAEVGAFCSGGVDSSLLMAMAARMHDRLAIFHANVVGRWSERDAAAALAKHLGLELRTVDVEDWDFIDRMPEVMRQYEHPFTYHPNCAPFMLVSRLVREHGVKGMLSGEGSDECFLGYPWLGREKVMRRYYRGLDQARRLVNKIPAVGRLIWPYEGNHRKVVRSLLNRCEVSEERRDIRERAGAVPGGTGDSHVRSLDYLNYHLRTLLHRNDCLGMEASIEARFPFLDHRVVKTAVNMPYRYKLRFDPTVLEKAHPMIRDKWVVRQVADRYIPRDLSRRIKIGFWTTIFERMRLSSDYFHGSLVREVFQLTPKQMAQVAGEAEQDLAMRLLHLDVWLHVCVDDRPADQMRSRLREFVQINNE